MKTQYHKSFDKREEVPANQEPIHMDTKEKELPPQQTPPPLAIVVNCSRLNVREKPTTSSASIGVLEVGTTVLIRSETDENWTYISGPSGINGHVMSMFIEKVVVKEEV